MLSLNVKVGSILQMPKVSLFCIILGMAKEPALIKTYLGLILMVVVVCPDEDELQTLLLHFLVGSG